jgi:hypothetical protein
MKLSERNIGPTIITQIVFLAKLRPATSLHLLGFLKSIASDKIIFTIRGSRFLSLNNLTILLIILFSLPEISSEMSNA